jgi:3-phenylpropionate/trans-cinnamate dioxygenase ferredoxin subunit
MPAPEGYVFAMASSDLEEGGIYPFSVDEEDRIVCMVDGEVFALDGICTHEYAELVDGEIEDHTLWCPLHSSGFNVCSGKATNLPAVIALPTYDVRVEEDAVYVSREPKANG